jgi:hypothetical protein
MDKGVSNDAAGQPDSGADGEDTGQEAAADGDATLDSGAVDAAATDGVVGAPEVDSDEGAASDGSEPVTAEEAMAGGDTAAGAQQDSNADVGEVNTQEDGPASDDLASNADAAVTASEDNGAAGTELDDAGMTSVAEAGSGETGKDAVPNGSAAVGAALAQPATQPKETGQTSKAVASARVAATDDLGPAKTAVDAGDAMVVADTEAQPAAGVASGKAASGPSGDASSKAASATLPTTAKGTVDVDGGAAGLHLAAEQATSSDGRTKSAGDGAVASAEASSSVGTAALVAAAVAGTKSSSAGTVSCQRWTPAGCSVVPGQVRAVSERLRGYALQGRAQVMA